ncbi:hypothetical protein J7K41_00280 [Candidatus Micrarchaeota archaeon]|nr:hypothetical protein [Candidatus Micrarchaeota archaeon]
MITIYADVHESRVVDFLKEYDANIVVRTLPVGDFVVSERLVVERKTRKDFENSIIDGRVFVQAKNMKDYFDKVVFVVEGSINENRLERNVFWGSCASLIAEFGLSIVFTEDAEETAKFIYALARHEQLINRRLPYVKGNRRVLTISEEQRAIIEALPGVGPTTAIRLLEHFGSVKNVINATEKELQEVEKIGKTKARRIRKVIETEFRNER